MTNWLHNNGGLYDLEPIEQQCPGCSRPFVPGTGGQLYCSVNCRKLTQYHHKRQGIPNVQPDWFVNRWRTEDSDRILAWSDSTLEGRIAAVMRMNDSGRAHYGTLRTISRGCDCPECSPGYAWTTADYDRGIEEEASDA